MTMVTIQGYVTFASNAGVMVEPTALELSPDELMSYVRIAFEHIRNPFLVEASCGGNPVG